MIEAANLIWVLCVNISRKPKIAQCWFIFHIIKIEIFIFNPSFCFCLIWFPSNVNSSFKTNTYFCQDKMLLNAWKTVSDRFQNNKWLLYFSIEKMCFTKQKTHNGHNFGFHCNKLNYFTRLKRATCSTSYLVQGSWENHEGFLLGINKRLSMFLCVLFISKYRNRFTMERIKVW